MWNNYIKPIIKTNLLALAWTALIIVIIIFPVMFILGAYFGDEVFQSGEIYKRTSYQIIETILTILFSLFITLKTATYLFKQETISKKKLVNLYLLFGVLSGVIMSAYLELNYPFDGNPVFLYASYLINILSFVIITKNVFRNNGKFNYKKII